MKKASDRALHYALELMSSPQGEVFKSELEAQIAEAVAKTRGEESGRVESAIELSREERERLEQTLNKILKRRVDLSYGLNRKLLGGLRVTVGDWKLDATLATQLVEMRQRLEEG